MISSTLADDLILCKKFVRNTFLKVYLLNRRKKSRVLAFKIAWLCQTGSEILYDLFVDLASQIVCFYLCEEVIESLGGIWVKDGVRRRKEFLEILNNFLSFFAKSNNLGQMSNGHLTVD